MAEPPDHEIRRRRDMAVLRRRLSNEALWRAYRALMRDGHPGIRKMGRVIRSNHMFEEPYHALTYDQIDRLRGLMTDATLRLAVRALAREHRESCNDGGP